MSRRPTIGPYSDRKVDLDSPSTNIGTRVQERDPTNLNRFAHGLTQNEEELPYREAPFDTKIEASPPHQDLASTGFVGATIVGKGRLRHRVKPGHSE